MKRTHTHAHALRDFAGSSQPHLFQGTVFLVNGNTVPFHYLHSLGLLTQCPQRNQHAAAAAAVRTVFSSCESESNRMCHPCFGAEAHHAISLFSFRTVTMTSSAPFPIPPSAFICCQPLH